MTRRNEYLSRENKNLEGELSNVHDQYQKVWVSATNEYIKALSYIKNQVDISSFKDLDYRYSGEELQEYHITHIKFRPEPYCIGSRVQGERFVKRFEESVEILKNMQKDVEGY